MSSYLEYVSCAAGGGSGGVGGDVLGFAPKFCRADARPVALQPAFPLGSGDGAFVSCLPLATARPTPSPPAVPTQSPVPQPSAPRYAPCTLEGAYERGAAPASAAEYGFLGSGPAFDFPGTLGRAADEGGAHVHYATSAVFSGGGSFLLSGQVDFAAFSELGPFPACLKEPADSHPGPFQTVSPAPGACPKPASPTSGLPAAHSTFEWMKVKRNAPKKSKEVGFGGGRHLGSGSRLLREEPCSHQVLERAQGQKMPQELRKLGWRPRQSASSGTAVFITQEGCAVTLILTLSPTE